MGASKVNVTMLGGRGAGKSSLLAVLYNSLKSDLLSSSLLINAVGGTGEKLSALYHQLQEFGFTGKEHKGIVGTTDPVKYTFDLLPRVSENNDSSLRIEFADYPGAWIHENKKYVRNRIVESSAILIAVDSTALMSNDRNRHDTVNAVNTFSDLLVDTVNNDNMPRLILIVPIKGEKWLQSKEGIRSLKERIDEEYGDIISNLKNRSTNALVITPIQTVGSVIFDKFIVNHEGREVPQWKKIREDAPFSPVDTEQPLKYLLLFLLNIYVKQNRSTEVGMDKVNEGLEEIKSGDDIAAGASKLLKGVLTLAGKGLEGVAERFGMEANDFWKSSIGELFNTFLGDEDFRKAVEAFYFDVKKKEPFEVVCGDKYLTT